jgi:hypothetical protein
MPTIDREVDALLSAQILAAHATASSAIAVFFELARLTALPAVVAVFLEIDARSAAVGFPRAAFDGAAAARTDAASSARRVTRATVRPATLEIDAPLVAERLPARACTLALHALSTKWTFCVACAAMVDVALPVDARTAARDQG